MHEMSVTESMLGVVLRHAESNKATSVTRINIVLGEFSTVMPESVQFYFDIIGKDTLAEGAELNFRRTKLASRCKDCGKEFEVVEYDFTCTKCKGENTEIISGREFQVESIEID
ncbi:MAG TPA: hydrogenase maturation nickel metallochaperone HypA [Candidatus Anoxymicrobiaceae bacterium]